MQQPQYKSAVELASDFVDVMEILWCYLKFDYCPAIYFNKILAKHSLPEIYVSGTPRDYFPAMDYAIVFEENTFPNFDESFISMLKYNPLFSELPNKSGCCKIIATDFINDNIATFEYLVQPSSVEKYNKAFGQLRDTKYEEVNPELKEKMKTYDARECEPFIRCLFFRKRVIPQRRNMLEKYCDIREENEYFSYSFVQSESSASNNNHIDCTVAEIGIQTDEQMRETADKAIQTAHIFDDDFCVNDSDEIQMEIDNVGGVDLASSCSILKPSILGTSRKSRRILEKANKVTSNAVEVPNICDASRAADDDDRDEIVSNSDGFHCFHKGDVQKYLSACDSKFKGDSHSALSHLAIHGYSIKKALERIDLPESLPMKGIHTDLGIWSKKEMQTFVKILSLNYQWKDGKLKKHPFWVKKVNKHLPDKSPKNCAIFYYTLKSAGFLFRYQTFKESSKFFKSTVKPQCENCINKLWKQSNLKQQSFNLCALCKLYLKLYEKHRPNAQALSEP
uniref:Uncharacterized protein n=1 Tax=Panagrolaimus sp. ES5 TaxID=591445 RepID=A0AC34F6P0_9BILA